MQNKMSNIVEEYKQARHNYEEYTEKMRELINSLINESEINVHSVSGRAKDVKNLEEKILRKGNSYNKLSDITDLSGIRIICYFSSQVEDVAKVIEENFTIIPELSVDKRKLLDPDRFGYLSLHYVAKISDTRKSLLEYRKYQNLLCEIQIRSILQHSWAEIEHDLGYKTSFEIPRDIKRRFYRLSGLLELADDEFASLKAEIEEYSKSLKNQQIEKNKEIFIDAISLDEYVSTSLTIKEMDTYIADVFYNKLENGSIHKRTFNILSYLNINKIYELNKIIEENKDEILFLAKEWANRPINKSLKEKNIKDASFDKGISFFYLGYVMIGKTMNIELIRDYLYEVIFPYDPKKKERSEPLAKDILNICKKYQDISKK